MYDNLFFRLDIPSAEEIANGTVVFPISRQEIETKNFNRINQLIMTLNSVGINARGNILLSVSGYDDDAREIYQIPEIREYYQKILSLCPHMLYFLTNDCQNAACFLYCIFDIISEKNGDTKIQIHLDTRSGNRDINKALSDFCCRVRDTKSISIEDILNSKDSFQENQITEDEEDEYEAAMNYLKKFERAHLSVIPFLSNETAIVCDYPGDLPDDLFYHHYYLLDSGHCIMAIPQSLYNEAKADGKYDEFEVPLPVKYVIERGYKIMDDRVIVDVPCDNMLGAMVDDKYTEVHQKPGE